MRIAFVGKGGAGKSSVAGTVCRQLARSGIPVLAMDVDTMPGMAFSIGISSGQARLPAGIFEVVKDRGWQLTRAARPARLVDRHAAVGPDGVRLVELGKLPGRVEPSTTVAFRYVLERFRRPGWAVVADLAGGTRQPMFRWARFAKQVIVVADPAAKSLMSARRLASVSTHLIANKVSGAPEARSMAASAGLPLLGFIPYDEAVVEADRLGLALIDAAPTSPSVRAALEITRRLVMENS